MFVNQRQRLNVRPVDPKEVPARGNPPLAAVQGWRRSDYTADSFVQGIGQRIEWVTQPWPTATTLKQGLIIGVTKPGRGGMAIVQVERTGKQYKPGSTIETTFPGDFHEVRIVPIEKQLKLTPGTLHVGWSVR